MNIPLQLGSGGGWGGREENRVGRCIQMQRADTKEPAGHLTDTPTRQTNQREHTSYLNSPGKLLTTSTSELRRNVSLRINQGVEESQSTTAASGSSLAWISEGSEDPGEDVRSSSDGDHAPTHSSV